MKLFSRRRKQPPKPSRLQQGLTLVELMVSIAVGIILVGGLAVYFAGQRKSYSYQEAVADLQDNARTALIYITRDLRQAGYIGCVPQGGQQPIGPDPENGVVGTYSENILDAVTLQNANPALPTLNPPLNEGWELAVMGVDNNGPVSTPQGAGDGYDANSDTLILNVAQQISTAANPTGFLIGVMDSKTANLNIIKESDGATPSAAELADAGIATGVVAAVSDCDQAAVFVIRNDPAGGAIQPHNGASPPVNVDLQHIYGSNLAGPAQLLIMRRVRYYLANSTADSSVRSLWRSTGWPVGSANEVTEELVEGVDGFAVTYGVASSCESGVTPNYQYLPATTNEVETVTAPVLRNAALQATARTGAVKIELVLRAADLAGDSMSEDSDRKVRQTISTVVELRNGC